MAVQKQGTKQITANKKAWHDYFIEDRYECGIELFGTEVKSIRQGTVSLKDSYCIFRDGEIFIKGMHISPYEKGNIFNKDPLRERKLLMHRREILKLSQQVKLEGCTIVPLSVYFKGPRVKLELGLAKGKKLYDKREDAARRDAQRNMERMIKER